MAQNDVTALVVFGGTYVLAGTCNGSVEIWECKGEAAPRVISTLQAHAAHAIFPQEHEGHDIHKLHPVTGNFYETSFRFGFVSEQWSEIHGTVLTLWQPSSLNLGKYFSAEDSGFWPIGYIHYRKCRRLRISCNGRRMLVLGYDKFGCLFLDIYHIRGSRFAFDEFGDANVPKDVDLTYNHPEGRNRIRFANRISIRHRIEFRFYPETIPETVVFDSNDRFIVISANNG